MSKVLVLYHTDGCHLCDDAMALLTGAQVDYTLCDICDDDALAEQYGVRIPVVRHNQSGKELNWPFDQIGLQSFLGEVFELSSDQ